MKKSHIRLASDIWDSISDFFEIFEPSSPKTIGEITDYQS